MQVSRAGVSAVPRRSSAGRLGFSRHFKGVAYSGGRQDPFARDFVVVPGPIYCGVLKSAASVILFFMLAQISLGRGLHLRVAVKHDAGIPWCLGRLVPSRPKPLESRIAATCGRCLLRDWVDGYRFRWSWGE